MGTSTIPRTWQEAFDNHSIPTVRTFEKQLLASVGRDKEKLRVLVGGNYHELLSTAEEIVSLSHHTKTTEKSISELSQQCKPLTGNDVRAQRPIHASRAAQLRLLIQCLSCASSTLQTGPLLVPAQLIVISRLLLKSLGEHDAPWKSLEQLRSRMSTVRHSLLRKIDVQLISPKSSLKTMVQGISAYCIVTSASSDDALKHFRNLRQEKLRRQPEGAVLRKLSLQELFRYFTISILSLKSLQGRSTNDAINGLQKQPIFEHPAIKSQESLGIEAWTTLIPRDITTFTPYIKRLTLSQSEANTIIEAWSQEAGQILVKHLSEYLKSSQILSDVLELRKDVVGTLVQSYFSVGAPQQVLTAIRETFNDRIVQLCRSQTELLTSTGESLIALNSVQGSNTVWQADTLQKISSRNSARYCYEVQSRRHGTQGDLHTLLKRLGSWSRQLLKTREQLSELTKVRWQDVTEEPDEEEEEVVQKVTIMLAKEDPRHYIESNDIALNEAVSKFEKMVNDLALSAASSSEEDSGDRTVKRILLSLRIIRESSVIIRRVLPAAKFEDFRASIPHLHAELAKVVRQRLESAPAGEQNSADRLGLTLEDLPSPRAFATLQQLCHIMVDIGGNDLWSAAAVESVKRSVCEHLFNDKHITQYTCNKFDQHYLRAALGGDWADEKRQREVATLEERQALAYWMRTKSLFGVLIP